MKEYQASPVSSLNHRDWSHDGKAIIPANQRGSLGLGITSCRPVGLLTIALQIKALNISLRSSCFSITGGQVFGKKSNTHCPISVPARCRLLLLDYLRIDSEEMSML